MYLRALIPSLAFASFALACGGTTFGGIDPDGGTASDAAHASDSATLSDGDFVGCNSDPIICRDNCGGAYNPVCENNQWVCPVVFTPNCAVDAGCPAVPIHCADPCGGITDPQCINGMWVCPPVPKEPPPPNCLVDASTPPALVCGSLVCNGSTEFCSEIGGGAQPLDGGSNLNFTCNPIPAACQTTPTCDCITKAENLTCPCTDTPSGVMIQCLFP
jgi:hypothetical protein